MNMLAVDIGGSHASCAVVNGQKILACRRIDLKGSGNLCDALPTIANVLQDIMASVHIPTENCAGIAFSFCGLVDSMRCCVMSTKKLYRTMYIRGTGHHGERCKCEELYSVMGLPC